MTVKKTDRFPSIRISRFLMKTVGFWPAETEAEKWLLNGILSYTICALCSCLWIEASEIYLGIGDFYAISYSACSTVSVAVILAKICLFTSNREKMLKMLKYTEDNFWYTRYDEYGNKVLKEIDKKGTIVTCTFTFFVQGTVLTYILTPIIENWGRNESDRKLPFNAWVGWNVSTTVSPNFEIIFFIEVLSLVHAALCFCCFDNLLGLLNMHAAGQFKILQHRLETIVERVVGTDIAESVDRKRKQEELYEEMRRCVRSHHELIEYSEKLEGIFTYTSLCQLIVSGVMICATGFQVFLARGSLVRRMIFIAYTNGCVCQLFVVTFTSNDLMEESRAVGHAAYNANWQMLPHEDNRGMRNAILMMMIRSMRACSISAGGFFPVSLETFMAVTSTAVSYFAVLRKFVAE